MVGIFPPGLGAAGTAIGQTAPMPLPLPVPGPAADPMGGSGADTGIDGNVGGLSRNRSRERPCKCPPEKGQRLSPPHLVTGLSAEYQHYVTGFPVGIEFLFSGKWFDGFYSPRCLLQEAKANYDFFFEENAAPKFFFLHGKGPKNPDTTESTTSAYKSIMREAETQSEVVIDNPPAELQWYFMQERFYKWATKEFLREALPISTEFKSMA